MRVTSGWGNELVYFRVSVKVHVNCAVFSGKCAVFSRTVSVLLQLIIETMHLPPTRDRP